MGGEKEDCNPEYYKDTHDFCSWTKFNLTELSESLFHNPSNDPKAFNFKRFLERQVKTQFARMKTVESLIKRDKDVLNPQTNEPMKIVMWPPTKQMKEIHIPQHLHEGHMDTMEFWAFDEATATIAIKSVLLLEDAKDLLRFRERDIHTMGSHQIYSKTELLEPGAKEFTSMVVTIIEKRLWLGAMGKMDVKLFKKT